MYLFIEKCIKGRYSYISKRYKKANNNYLKFYDPKHKTRIWKCYIPNKYTRMVMRYLNFFQQGTRVFKWIDTKNFDSDKYSNKRSKGWVLEVDIEYPK